MLDALKNAGPFELADEPKRGALGYAASVSDITESRVGVVGETNQHVGVVAEEGPVPEDGVVPELTDQFISSAFD